MRSFMLFLFAWSGAAAQAPTQAELSQRVDSMFAEHTRDLRPGLAVAVVRDGRVLHSKGYGYANLEHRIPVTSATVFDVASVSKQFAGLAVALLVQEGRIKLTDDIRTYVPELADVGHTVTVDHLVHHTSGYRDWPGTLALAGWRMDDVIAFDQILNMAYHQRTLNFAPGSEHMYSNTGYNLLAELVARVSGKSFRQFTEDRMFGPLGMASSHFHDNHQEIVAHRATGYSRRPDGSYAAVTDNLMALGSSSLFSTVDDLARWVMNFDDPRVGGAAAMELLRAPGKLNDGSPVPYAFGIVNGEYRGQPMLTHGGSWASFATYVLHFPRQRFGVILLSNSPMNVSRVSLNVADLYLDGVLGAASANTNPLAAGAAVTVAPEVLDRWAGLYRLGPGWYVRLRREGAVLRTRATREQEFPLAARADSLFWVAAYNQPMTFHSAAAGSPVHLEYRGRRVPRLDEPERMAAARLGEFVGEYESPELKTTYRVEQAGDSLVLKHWRHGTIGLTHLWQDDFGGGAWFLRSVEFQRDGSARVTGFAVYVDDRSRNVRFVRRRE